MPTNYSKSVSPNGTGPCAFFSTECPLKATQVWAETYHRNVEKMSIQKNHTKKTTWFFLAPYFLNVPGIGFGPHLCRFQGTLSTKERARSGPISSDSFLVMGGHIRAKMEHESHLYSMGILMKYT